MSSLPSILTLGHSTHTWEWFVSLLKLGRATAVADVRSAPYSRHTPYFSREKLAAGLRREAVEYVFLGGELGGRPSDPHLFSGNIADYEKMARTESFQTGLTRVINGASRYRIALLCAERDPLNCHRFLLVSRRLAERGLAISHILPDGSFEDHRRTEERLLDATERRDDDLYASQSELLSFAYRDRGRRVAFEESSSNLDSQLAAK